MSFRPLLQLPRWIPLAGFLSSAFAMGVVNPTLSLVAVAIVVFFYVVLLRTRLEAPFGDMRSGLFVSLAEWAAKKVVDLPAMEERAWKPNLLIPVEDPRAVRGAFQILRDVTHPKGSVNLMGVRTDRADEQLDARVYALENAFRQRGIFASRTVIDSPGADGLSRGLIAGMQSLRSSFFKPNVLFLNLVPEEDREEEFGKLLAESTREEIGTLVHAPHVHAGLGERRTINVWIRDRSPDWRLSMDIGNLDLPILIGYKLLRSWDATMRLITALDSEESLFEARQFLEAVLELGRIPRTRVVAVAQPFEEYLPQAPQADVSIFGLGDELHFHFMRRMVDETRSTCLFARDSGRESALA